MKDKLFMKVLLLVLIHGTCPKSRIPWRKIISASPDIFLGLQMFKVTTKLSHTHEPRSGRSLSHLPHPQCPWASTPGQSTHRGGSEPAAVLFLLSFTIISVLPCLHHQKAKGVEERKKKELTISIFFLAPFWAIRRDSVISLPSIMDSAGWVTLMKKGMLTSRVYLKREGPRASRFRTSQFRISQISDTWLRTGPRWELTPWPGRAGIKEITLLSKTTDVAGSGGVCL